MVVGGKDDQLYSNPDLRQARTPRTLDSYQIWLAKNLQPLPSSFGWLNLMSTHFLNLP